MGGGKLPTPPCAPFKPITTPTQASLLSTGTETEKLSDDYADRVNHGAVGKPSEGAPAVLMVPQVCPRTVRSLDPTEPMAPVAASVGESGGPYGDAVRARKARAASSGECGGPYGDAAPAAQKEAAAATAAAAVIAKSTTTTAKTVSEKQDAREFQNSLVSTKSGECGGPYGNAVSATKKEW